MTNLRDQLIRETVDYRNSLQDDSYFAVSLKDTMRRYVDQLRTSNFDPTQYDPGKWLMPLNQALDRPDAVVDPQLFSEYVKQLSLVMENTGAGLVFREAFDRVISFCQSRGLSATDLYLAKIEYTRLTDTESEEKKRILEEAYNQASNESERLLVMKKRVQYFIDSSEYKRALEEVSNCRNLIDSHPDLDSHRAKLEDLVGIIYYSQFKYDLAEQHLEIACELSKAVGDEHTLGEALHHLARIYQAGGNYQRAIDFYVVSAEHQTENVADKGWFHLRIGELLLECNLFTEAHCHFNKSQELFGRIQYNGSALSQVILAWAAYHEAQQQYKEAEARINDAIEFSRQTKFRRGELRSLWQLFRLSVKRLRPFKAFTVVIRALITRELRKQPQLILFMVQELIRTRRFYGTVGATAQGATLNACTCKLHSPNTPTPDLSKYN